MTHFMGTHRNKLDAKMRVSVPASFRTVLKDQGGVLVLRSSHLYPSIEAWPKPEFDNFQTSLHLLEEFSDRHDALAASLYADAYALEPDKDGRVVLPEAFVDHAGLTDMVAFIGLGRSFQIWEPEAGARFVADARARARAGALTLPAAA